MEREREKEREQRSNRVRDGVFDRNGSVVGPKWPLREIEHLSIFSKGNL
jgi:hypothetical protein